MCEVISNSNVPYRGPSHEAICGELLDAVKAKVEDGCKSWWDHAMKVTGFVLGSDGWTDAQSRPLLNFMLVSPKGVKFVRALDTSGQQKPGDFIADKIGEVIDEVGPEYISAVIMDGVYNNVSASELLEER